MVAAEYAHEKLVVDLIVVFVFVVVVVVAAAVVIVFMDVEVGYPPEGLTRLAAGGASEGGAVDVLILSRQLIDVCILAIGSVGAAVVLLRIPRFRFLR